MRVEGLAHNMFNVLVFLGIPLSVVGILALPWQARDRALRPVVLISALAFLVTGFLFPVATTWGTFLHAAAPVHVLIIVSALGVLDAGLARLGRRMGWTRPIAWLGAVLAVGGSALFAVALVPIIATQARDTARTYEVLAREMAAIGAPLDGAHPVIHDFPIWLAETQRVPALALPGRDAVGRARPRRGVRRPVAHRGQGLPGGVHRPRLQSDPRMARTELGFLRELLRRELGNIRDFINQLRPPLLDELGLDGAIEETVGRLRTTSGPAITTNLEGPAEELGDQQRTVVLRVTQEALQNVRKHAGASMVVVNTAVVDDDWTLEFATTVADSIRERWPRVAVAISDCSSCANVRN